jgi:hypothetical protein
MLEFVLITAMPLMYVKPTVYRAAEMVRTHRLLVAPMIPAGVSFEESEDVKPVAIEPVPFKMAAVIAE